MSTQKRLLLTIAIMLTIAVLAGIGAVVVQPSLVTGRFYEITITAIDIGPHGELKIEYNDRLSYDTEILCEGPAYTYNEVQLVDTWDERKPDVLRWPRKYEGMTLRIYVRSTQERDSGLKNLEMYRGRVLVKEGVYRIRAGETLPLYRFKDADGREIEGRIAVRPRS